MNAEREKEESRLGKDGVPNFQEATGDRWMWKTTLFLIVVHVKMLFALFIAIMSKLDIRGPPNFHLPNLDPTNILYILDLMHAPPSVEKLQILTNEVRIDV